MKMESEREILSPAQLELQRLKEQKELEKTNPQNQLALLPNRLCLIVDTSSSMLEYFGSNMDRAKAAAKAMHRIVVASNSRDTSYSLVIYNTNSHLIHPQNTPFSKFLSTTFEPVGTTHLYPGLDLALSQKPTRCIVLSDGQIFDHEACRQLVIQQYKPKNIKIDTIAIGEANDAFLKELAEMTGGRFSRADSPAGLENTFLQLEPKNYLRLEHKNGSA